MTLHLRPVGRGRWRLAVFTLISDRAAPFTVKVGDRFPLGGITWRVVAVLP